MTQAGFEDQETGLGTPSKLEAAFAQAVARAQRRKEAFSLILLEVADAGMRDRPIGAVTARAVGDELRAMVGSEDTVVRLENQVFAVLLGSKTQPEALMLAARARGVLGGRPLPGEEAPVSLAARSGVVEWREGRGGLGETLEDAQWDLEQAGRGVEGR